METFGYSMVHQVPFKATGATG